MALAVSMKGLLGLPFPTLTELRLRYNEDQTLCLGGNQRGNQTQQMPLALPFQSVPHHITKRSNLTSQKNKPFEVAQR